MYFIFGDLINEEIKRMFFEKEVYYRELCFENKDELKLMKGFIGVLNYLKKLEMLMIIVMVMVKENVEFYFDVFYLG